MAPRTLAEELGDEWDEYDETSTPASTYDPESFTERDDMHLLEADDVRSDCTSNSEETAWEDDHELQEYGQKIGGQVQELLRKIDVLNRQIKEGSNPSFNDEELRQAEAVVEEGSGDAIREILCLQDENKRLRKVADQTRRLICAVLQETKDELESREKMIAELESAVRMAIDELKKTNAETNQLVTAAREAKLTTARFLRSLHGTVSPTIESLLEGSERINVSKLAGQDWAGGVSSGRHAWQPGPDEPAADGADRNGSSALARLSSILLQIVAVATLIIGVRDGMLLSTVFASGYSLTLVQETSPVYVVTSWWVVTIMFLAVVYLTITVGDTVRNQLRRCS